MENPIKYFIAGDNMYDGPIFRYNSLDSGHFQHFICPGNFTYDSDIFNASLSNFVRQYDYNGHLLIVRFDNLSNPMLLGNSFDPLFLMQRVENHDEVLRYVPTFICDNRLRWCIFLHNDLDVFISWTDASLTPLFDHYFKHKNKDFYFEPDHQAFITMAVLQGNYKKDFDELLWKKALYDNNSEMFR